MNVDGTDEHYFLDEYGKSASLTFGPVGTSVVWAGAIANWEPTAEIYEAPIAGGIVDTSKQTQLTDNSTAEGHPAYSPDFTHLVFDQCENPSGYGKPRNIYVMEMSDHSTTRLTTYSGSDAAFDPNFSPDGDKIVYCYDDGDGYDICVMNADGTDIQNLTSSTNVDMHADWGIVPEPGLSWIFAVLLWGVKRTTGRYWK